MCRSTESDIEWCMDLGSITVEEEEFCVYISVGVNENDMGIRSMWLKQKFKGSSFRI